MVKFLLHKPIAVTMTFIAILILGMVSLTRIPVSLMPDIAIPEITVQVSQENTSARELENTVVRILRQQLLQVAHLEDIKSETIDGQGTIKLKFEYGTDIDFAFIEVNEKVDRSMNNLPKTLERPKVIKASVGDIPVFYLNLTLKDQNSKSQLSSSINQPSSSLTVKQESELYPVSQDFVELSHFASNVIRKRLEQLSEVAMVDLSGLAKTEILIMPDLEKLDALGITLEQLQQIINKNNIKLGNLSIHDGQYLFNVRFSTSLKDKRDIENILLRTDNRLYQLKDIATVIEHPRKLKGMVLSNGMNAVTMAVIKQSDAQMNDLKNSLRSLVNRFEKDYPTIQFEVIRDQAKLLDYSIANLGQSLWWGAMLAFFVMFFFLRDVKSPLLIGITIPVSLVISLLFFHLIGLSINIISLSGLILGIGMMIDNSIIVIDNISQHYERTRLKSSKGLKSSNGVPIKSGSNFSTIRDQKSSDAQHQLPSIEHLNIACINGTNEVFRPMLSSVLTTCAVFIPLIFIKGISGALFYDQAMAITIGLFVSLVVSITLLPVYYLLVYKSGKKFGKVNWLKKINGLNYEQLYEKGFRFVMRHQITSWVLILLCLIGGVMLYQGLHRSKLPIIAEDELIVHIDWNNPVNVLENKKRVESYLAYINSIVLQSNALIGEQQFLLEKSSLESTTGTMIYLKLKNRYTIDSLKTISANYLEENFREANYYFEDAANIFNVIFSDDEPPLEVRLRPLNDYGPAYKDSLQAVYQKMKDVAIGASIHSINWQEHVVLLVNPEKLLLYNIEYNQLYSRLRSLFNENEIFLITDNTDFVPVILGGKPKVIQRLLEESSMMNSKGKYIPVRELVELSKDYDLKRIVAGKEGEHYPLILPLDQPEKLMADIKRELRKGGGFEASFSGSYFSNREMIRQLAIVLIISLALLYFILASQFESLTLPIIVLLEVPIDFFGALLFLKLFGGGINLMSLIGIIVMSGIIINDSILKIDTINQLRREGYGLIRAMATAGQRRLKPILMTSITTILALAPFLFTQGLGSDLQKPLALTVIGGMLIGTLVSLFFIPLCYYYLEKKRA